MAINLPGPGEGSSAGAVAAAERAGRVRAVNRNRAVLPGNAAPRREIQNRALERALDHRNNLRAASPRISTDMKIATVIAFLLLGLTIGLNFANMPTVWIINGQTVVKAAAIIVGVGNIALWVYLVYCYYKGRQREKRINIRETAERREEVQNNHFLQSYEDNGVHSDEEDFEQRRGLIPPGRAPWVDDNPVEPRLGEVRPAANPNPLLDNPHLVEGWEDDYAEPVKRCEEDHRSDTEVKNPYPKYERLVPDSKSDTEDASSGSDADTSDTEASNSSGSD